MRNSYALITKAQAGDAAARKELVQRNLGLIYKFTAKRVGWGRANEFVSYGVEGFLRAVDRFDASRGCALSTYASVGVWNAVRTVAHRELVIAGRIAFSFDNTSKGRAGNGDQYARQEPADPRSQTGYCEDYSEEVACLTEGIRALPKRLAHIIRERMAGKTLRQVGKLIGRTAECVRQRELQAHKFLRERLLSAGHAA